MTNLAVTSQSIAVDHIRIVCRKAFDQVRAALAAELPELDAQIIPALASGDRTTIEDYEKRGPKLFIFLERNHGALLKSTAEKRNAVQYEIGNPITAATMTCHQLGASLYAPLRVALYEMENGEAVFEYDRPSSLFGQFHDERVRQVGLYLDRELEAVLLRAAS
ncbi:DUF302 domain-containing protein [Gluconacetobacter tumulicola]|uniref:DUF302 domain-containing protein n=1 Tax=Gluconacetobacter tumulicola TaxID=1017177 RepID=A0A7W4JCB9_9PROT|nr:DUF302 domain-containing protein [Gluconacetobacter tumulicola]MBB2178644.1 DUF302 domain-containing protein [Gluconacetobacter tumulicola]